MDKEIESLKIKIKNFCNDYSIKEFNVVLEQQIYMADEKEHHRTTENVGIAITV